MAGEAIPFPPLPPTILSSNDSFVSTTRDLESRGERLSLSLSRTKLDGSRNLSLRRARSLARAVSDFSTLEKRIVMTLSTCTYINMHVNIGQRRASAATPCVIYPSAATEFLADREVRVVQIALMPIHQRVSGIDRRD